MSILFAKMNGIKFASIFLYFLVAGCACGDDHINGDYIRVNQAGYHNKDIKTAILGSDENLNGKIFFVKNIDANQIVFSNSVKSTVSAKPEDTPFAYNHIIDFSPVETRGQYRIELQNGRTSPVFRIGNDAYGQIIDFLLYYLRVARCGDNNAALHQPCHLHDATNIDVDLTGGWHDAGDFLKFTKQEAYTTYLLLLAYEVNKNVHAKFRTDHNHNGIVDILDEAKVGLDYLVKCYPDRNTFFYQVGDPEVDHRQGTRMPENDKLAEHSRPAFKGFSRDDLSKYAFTMALGYTVFKNFSLFASASEKYLRLAKTAYEKAKLIGENDQDKLCLAAVELFEATKENRYLQEAIAFNDKLSMSEWGHYGDTTNLAHARLGKHFPEAVVKLKKSVRHFYNVSQRNLFGFSVSYTWGSLYNALSSANAGWFYQLLSGDDSYEALQRRIREYTLGLNPWGVCFISGIGTHYPKNLHNSVAKSLNKSGLLKDATYNGAIAEGPFDRQKWESKWAKLVPRREDKYLKFHTANAVYHDHNEDYVTNEPCIYGAAEAILFFSFYDR